MYGVKCKEPLCSKRVDNKDGLCQEHRPRKCSYRGCEIRFLQRTDNKRCKIHRVHSYRTDVTEMNGVFL